MPSAESLETATTGPIKLLAAPSTSGATYIPVILNVGVGGLDVRVNGREIQKSLDGTNWTTIGKMNLRLNGANFEFTLNEQETTPNWYPWIGKATCPTGGGGLPP